MKKKKMMMMMRLAFSSSNRRRRRRRDSAPCNYRYNLFGVGRSLSLSPFSSLFFDVELKILKDEREKTSSSSSSSSISYAFK